MITITSLLLAGALGAQRPLARPSSDTIPDASDTVARVTFDFGAGATTPLLVQDFDAGFSPSANAATSAGSVRVHFVKLPDAFTPELAHRGASAERIPSVTIEVTAGGGPGKTLMTFRLSDVL